jgi:hypothetical protein
MRPVSSIASPYALPPLAHHRHVDGEDVEIRDLQPRSPDQQEQGHEQQQIILIQDLQRIQQTMSWYAKEANRRLEIEQETQPYLDKLSGNLSNL